MPVYNTDLQIPLPLLAQSGMQSGMACVRARTRCTKQTLQSHVGIKLLQHMTTVYNIIAAMLIHYCIVHNDY